MSSKPCHICGGDHRDHTAEENVQLRELLGYVAGLLQDVHEGVPPDAEGLARVCVRTTLAHVRKVGVVPRRVWGGK